jgi:hypothetical protein
MFETKPVAEIGTLRGRRVDFQGRWNIGVRGNGTEPADIVPTPLPKRSRDNQKTAPELGSSSSLLGIFLPTTVFIGLPKEPLWTVVDGYGAGGIVHSTQDVEFTSKK